jgi:regulator of protease activity HflC (stomatin/prohibitin superfamily)
METIFGLFGRILEAVLSFVPRMVIVRATHNAVKWKRGKHPRAVPPGLTVYWPLVTDMDQIVVARQTLNLPTQTLMTSDQKQVIVGAFVVYRINDVVQAIGERNWDVESTLGDITQAAIVEEITKRTLNDLLAGISGGQQSSLSKALKKNCLKQLRPFGLHVERCGLTDFSTTRVYRLIGNDAAPSQQFTEE